MNRLSYHLLLCMLISINAFAQISRYPYTERFDSSAGFPFGWSGSGMAVTAGSAYSVPNAVLATGNTSAKQMLSPVFSFADRIPAQLQFYERRSATAAAFRLELRATTDGLTFPIFLTRFDTISSVSSYVRRIIDLQAAGLAGQAHVQFRWSILKDSTNGTGSLRIDDVTMSVLVSSDARPSSVLAAPASPTSADSLIISCWIHNDGHFPVAQVPAKLFLDENGNRRAEDGEMFATPVTGLIAPGDSFLIQASHAPVSSGNRTFLVVASLPSDENRANDTAAVTTRVSAVKGSVIVNEIMYAPAGDEPEWIELYHPFPDSLNVRGWTVSDIGIASRSLISSTDAWLAPFGYAILAKDPSFLSLHPATSCPVFVVPFSQLNNTTPDAVVLYDPVGSTVDSVSYLPSWGGQGGRSLERVDWMEGSTGGNWKTSVDAEGSSPGRRNSVAKLDTDAAVSSLSALSHGSGFDISAVIRNEGRQSLADASVRFFYFAGSMRCDLHAERLSASLRSGDSILVQWQWLTPPSGENRLSCEVEFTGDQRSRNDTLSILLRAGYEKQSVIINEIMYDPLEGGSEWVELYNRGNASVDLTHWTISDQPTASGNTNEFTLASHQLFLMPGAFAVIAADSTIFLTFPPLSSTPASIVVVLGRSSGLGLNADGDGVILRDLTGAAIDSVSYLPTWHHPDISDTRGRSLERINADIPANDPRNWNTCPLPAGGTPALPNSIRTSILSVASSLSLSPDPFTPDADGDRDFCAVTLQFPAASVWVSIQIYDVRGRTVRTLANNEIRPGESTILWDGMDDNRHRVRIGIYIVLVEVSDHESGEVHRLKQTVVVAGKF